MMRNFKRYSAAVFCALAFVSINADLSAQAMPSFFKRKTSARKRTDAPTVVEAATMDIDMENNVATLLGNVVVDDQDVKITCDKMVICLEEKPVAPEESEKTGKAKTGNGGSAEASSRTAAESEDPAGGKQLKKIECFGEVVITHRGDPGDSKQKDQVATSDYALYDVAAGTITLTGHPVLTSGTDRLDAEKIVVEIETGRTFITTGKGTYYGDTPISGAGVGKSKK